MRKRKIPGDRVITSALVLLLLAGTSISIVSAGQSDAPPRGVSIDLGVGPERRSR